jgi:Na+/H+ antiporter NhaD/arsenite permease-like protein
MEFIILNIKLIAAYFVTFILFCIFFQILNKSRLHTFVIMQKLIRNSGKRKLIKFFLTISFMMLNLLLIGRVDITIYQMGAVLGAGFALIHILTKPIKKVNSNRRVEHT